MKLRQARTGRRGAFTLIELLVVISIIAILMALTTAAVMRAMAGGPRAQNRAELGQLAAAMDQFKAKFGNYPPSLFIVKRTLANYGSTGMEAESKAFLLSMFPRLSSTEVISASITGTGSATLHGQECLVFFLGGVQVTGPNGCTGYSTNPTAPFSTAGGTRIGPFVEFKGNRLVMGQSGSFLQYTDAHGARPFVYLSSNNTRNGYHPVADSTLVDPYKEANSPVRFHNPNTFQIISAGEDRDFGPGGVVWGVGNGASGPGQDDISNFHKAPLGAP